MFKYITFATSNWYKYKQRYLNIFGNDIHFSNENDINDKWFQELRNKFPYDCKLRGFYYYIWKPIYILQEINKLNENDILFYLDAGCDNLDRQLIDNFLNEFHKSNEFIACTSAGSKNIRITSSNFKNKYHPDDIFLYKFPHYQAGILFIKKSKIMIDFITRWIKMMKEDYETIIRTYKKEPDVSNNGGDQIYMQWLLYKENIKVFKLKFDSIRLRVHG
jgi:hypothetical protein